MKIPFFKKKLFYQIFLLSSLGSFLILFVIVFLVTRSQQNVLTDNMHIQGESFSKALIITCGNDIINNDKSSILDNTMQLMMEIPNIKFVAISINNKMLIIEKDQWKEVNEKFGARYYTHNKHIIEEIPFLKQYGKLYIHNQPLVYGGIVWGWVHIGFSLDFLKDSLERFYISLVWVFSLMPIIIMAIAYIFSRKISKPIEQLSNNTKLIIQGETNIVFTHDRYDEIGELSRNFEKMILKLNETTHSLRESNEFLELKVFQRTQELLDINLSLDYRVKEEVKKQQDQEQLMIQQSRFAAMGEMMGNIAHQWRQPLNALSLLIQNIKFAYDFGTIDAEYIDYVNEQGLLLTGNMSTTIDDFRDFFSNNKEGKEFNLYKEINNTLLLMKGTFTHNNIQVSMQVDNTITIHGIVNEFSQVMLNLLKNAQDILIENTVFKPYIKIRGYQDTAYFYCDVEDNGGGIPSAVIEKVFDPYFTTKEEGRGTGIGLYMSKVIIEKHMNGTLTAINGEHGAIFTIKIPKKIENRDKNPTEQ